MTRFSPEYIAFILSDEASVLQPRFFEQGDWAYLDGKPRLVKLVDREARVLIGSAWYGMENLKWLPTLSDLLGMIEEVGYFDGSDVDRILDIIGPSWELPGWYVGDQDGSFYCEDKDLMLAAAKLAVRVLEGQ